MTSHSLDISIISYP